MSEKATHVLISGRVQGVGFRYWVLYEAQARALTGWVRNLPDGRVEAVFAGPVDAVDDMAEACWRGPSLSRVTAVEVGDHAGESAAGFEIRH